MPHAAYLHLDLKYNYFFHTFIDINTLSMPANKDFALRIEIIDECLRNNFRKWTLQSLIDSVNIKLEERYGKSASKRTIQEDLHFMKNDKGAPIEKEKKGNITYFYYSDPTFSLKNLPIQEEEIALLNDAINILRQVSDFKLVNDVDNIITKLQNAARANFKGTPSIIQFERHTVALGTEYIDDIFTAIKEKSPLRISYQSFKSVKPKEHLFHPYLLKEYRNRWFLVGLTHNSSASLTNLALDRIRGIKNCSSPFIPNSLFDPDTYYHNLIGVTMPGKKEILEIEIKCFAAQAPFVRTKPIHHTQEIIKEYQNGNIIVRLKVMHNHELQSVLLAYGNELEVLRPLELRAKLKNIFTNAAAVYNKKS